jgi:hypothetical protein
VHSPSQRLNVASEPNINTGAFFMFRTSRSSYPHPSVFLSNYKPYIHTKNKKDILLVIRGHARERQRCKCCSAARCLLLRTCTYCACVRAMQSRSLRIRLFVLGKPRDTLNVLWIKFKFDVDKAVREKNE